MVTGMSGKQLYLRNDSL